MTIANKTIPNKSGVVPLHLRLDEAKAANALRLPTGWLRTTLLKRVWWHTKAYLPILSVLLLTVGSLAVLQLHWLYQWLLQTPVRVKEVLKNAA